MRSLKQFLLLVTCLFSINAFAIELGDAKDQGLVGEQPDGYLGIVVNRPDVFELVTDVNQKRKVKYLQVAKDNSIALEQVEKLAAQKAFSKTQSGHFLLVDGKWTKKP